MLDTRESQFSILDNEQLLQALHSAKKSGADSDYLSCLQEQIVNRNAGLVKSIAREFLYSGELLDDLVQAGYIGLLNAVTNFDLAHKGKFSTYAHHLITGEIRHYIRGKHTTVRIPQWVQLMNRKLNEAQEEIFQQQGRPPKISELAEHLEITEQGVAELLKGREAMIYVSIDQYRRKEDPHPSLPDITRVYEGQEGLQLELRTRIIAAIEKLSLLQQEVIKGLFYQAQSQTQVGQQLGIPQRKVSRIKTHTMDEIKRELLKGDNQDG